MSLDSAVLTDYLLTVECGVFVVMLARRGAGVSWVVMFAATAAASLFGGAWHSLFLPDSQGFASRALWSITLLCFGVIAVALVRAALGVGWGREQARRLDPIQGIVFAGYTAVVLFVSQDFIVGIAAYLPAALFLMFVFARNLWYGRPEGAVAAILGVGITIVGAVAQNAGVALHPVYFDHNALFHAVQAVALYLLFRAALEVGESS